MSSYLAALVVGNFEYLEAEADGIPIRVYTTTGKKEMGKFALEVADDILKYYDNYFGIKYPYGKLDLVGIPDFSAGAMENTGCITFREVLLLIEIKMDIDAFDQAARQLIQLVGEDLTGALEGQAPNAAAAACCALQGVISNKPVQQ